MWRTSKETSGNDPTKRRKVSSQYWAYIRTWKKLGMCPSLFSVYPCEFKLIYFGIYGFGSTYIVPMWNCVLGVVETWWLYPIWKTTHRKESCSRWSKKTVSIFQMLLRWFCTQYFFTIRVKFSYSTSCFNVQSSKMETWE